MIKMPLILLLILSPSFAIAQGDDGDEIFKAIDWIEGITMAAIKSGALESEPLIIIDGIAMSGASQFSAALEGIYANSIKDDSVLDELKAKQHFDGEKGRRGVLLIVLNNKAHRRFSKNIRKFEKSSAAGDGLKL